MRASTTPAREYRRRHSAGGAAAALVAAALVLSGCAASPTVSGEVAPPLAAGSSPASSLSPQSPEAAPSAIPVRPATPPAAATVLPAPTSLTVAGTAINMPVVPGGVSGGGAMEIPDAFDRAAWYEFGPAPGAAEGVAVIAGHIDTSSDRAPFSALKSLPAGTVIRVGRNGAPPLTYRVVRVELMAKDQFDGPSLFRRSGPHELKLVTCGGRWLDERMDYSDNVIVTAVPA
jgi:Sortase domain